MITPGTKRILYLILIIINIPLGLATRFYANYFPAIMQEYGGDVFSASCIFFGMRFLFISKKITMVALLSYVVCIGIEILQLYQAPWIVKLRHTPPFGILLGYGFLWSDLLCYAVGVAGGYFIALIMEKKLLKITEL